MMSIMDKEVSRGNIHGVFLPWLLSDVLLSKMRGRMY